MESLVGVTPAPASVPTRAVEAAQAMTKEAPTGASPATVDVAKAGGQSRYYCATCPGIELVSPVAGVAGSWPDTIKAAQ